MAAARALPLGPVTMFNPYVRGTAYLRLILLGRGNGSICLL
jgi:hypothetical protein